MAILEQVRLPLQDISGNKALRKLCGQTFRVHAERGGLRRSQAQAIRVGIAGGLPFDSLTTDLVQGCLPASEVCYGSCFAARAAFDSGIDFGARVANRFEPETIVADLALLPAGQGFLRNGWNSDPSWNWGGAAALAGLIRQSGRLPVFITKYFTHLTEVQTSALVQAGAELRISIAAFDSPAQVRMRLQAACAYRDAGGVAIPVIMTAAFADETHARQQQALVDYCQDRDFALAENSLRFGRDNPVLAAIDLSRCRLTADTGEYWSGRLYPDLAVCTLTSVPSAYRGLQSPWLSRNDPQFLRALWRDPVPTHAQVLSDVSYRKPSQCGIGKSW